MNIFKTRLWLSILAGIAFVAPLGAVVAVEHTKNVAKLQNEQKDYQASLAESEAARSTYYQNIDAKKADLKQAMLDAEAKYQAILKDQPNQIAAHQTTTTQTTTEPVTVTKLVPVTSSTSTTSQPATKPKSTRKTKTS